MHHNRFDSLIRRVNLAGTRRDILGIGLGGVFGLPALREADARRKGRTRRRRGKRARPNEFGCFDAGQPCRGQDGRCCSGICQGRKPKKGEKDTSRCVGHDANGCTPERSLCVAVEVDPARCNLPS